MFAVGSGGVVNVERMANAADTYGIVVVGFHIVAELHKVSMRHTGLPQLTVHMGLIGRSQSCSCTNSSISN